MTIVINRGNSRQEFVVPTGTVLARFSEEEQAKLVADFKLLLGVE